jgi:hypothetical protein
VQTTTTCIWERERFSPLNSCSSCSYSPSFRLIDARDRRCFVVFQIPHVQAFRLRELATSTHRMKRSRVKHKLHVRKPQARFSKSSSGLDNEFPSFCTSNESEEAKKYAQTGKRLGTDGRTRSPTQWSSRLCLNHHCSDEERKKKEAREPTTRQREHEAKDEKRSKCTCITNPTRSSCISSRHTLYTGRNNDKKVTECQSAYHTSEHTISKTPNLDKQRDSSTQILGV